MVQSSHEGLKVPGAIVDRLIRQLRVAVEASAVLGSGLAHVTAPSAWCNPSSSGTQLSGMTRQSGLPRTTSSVAAPASLGPCCWLAGAGGTESAAGESRPLPDTAEVDAEQPLVAAAAAKRKPIEHTRKRSRTDRLEKHVRRARYEKYARTTVRATGRFTARARRPLRTWFC